MRRRRPPIPELQRVYREHVSAVFAFFGYSVSQGDRRGPDRVDVRARDPGWSDYDPERGPERAWVLAIARNLLTDHYRRQRHRDTVSTDEHPILLDVAQQRRLGREPPDPRRTARVARRSSASASRRCWRCATAPSYARPRSPSSPGLTGGQRPPDRVAVAAAAARGRGARSRVETMNCVECWPPTTVAAA